MDTVGNSYRSAHAAHRTGNRQGQAAYRFGVASEGVLQQARQLGVTVGHVRALGVDERLDHVAQRSQRQVDVVGLLQAVARGPSL
jgi:hypothetical protein